MEPGPVPTPYQRMLIKVAANLLRGIGRVMLDAAKELDSLVKLEAGNFVAIE